MFNKTRIPHLRRFKSHQGLWIISCEEVFLLRCPLMPEIIRENIQDFILTTYTLNNNFGNKYCYTFTEVKYVRFFSYKMCHIIIHLAPNPLTFNKY